jgi:hypothetical protein
LSDLITESWPVQGVIGAFFPWKYVTDLPTAASPIRQKMLRKILQLRNGSSDNAPADQSVASPAAHLRPSDVQSLVNIVRELPDFQDQNGRRVLVEVAGLTRPLAGIDFEGNTRTVAR